MKRSGARLTVPGAMSRQAMLEIGTETNSASLARAEREIKSLKAENSRLRTDLADVRSLYNQLVQENSHERFDERRVMLLKSQIIQLERQILVLSEALSGRGEVLMEVENSLTWLADKCRSYIVMDVRGAEVSIARSDLTLMVETAESARIKLFKRLENNTPDKLARPLLFYNEFIHPSREQDITWLDVAYGNVEHVNLKHVTKLETKLSHLYKDLIHLQGALENDGSSSSSFWSSGHVTKAARERLSTHLLKSCAIIKDCSDDLLDLSLLFPSAPWPPLKRATIREITPDRVLRCLPSATRSKAGETQRIIQALVKAYNYRLYMLQNEVKSLREELKYHQSLYNVQFHYTESLFTAVREAYSSFEDSSNEVIVKPLRDILEGYVELSRSASEVALKEFLTKFKENAAQLQDIVETMSVKSEESEGASTLSSFGEEFFRSVDKLVEEQQRKRDQVALNMEDIRSEQEKLDKELRDILTEQEQRLESTMNSAGNDSNKLNATSASSESYLREKTEEEHSARHTGNQKSNEVKTKSEKDQLLLEASDVTLAESTGTCGEKDKKVKNKRPEWDNTLYNPYSEDVQNSADTVTVQRNQDDSSSPDQGQSLNASSNESTVVNDKPPTVKPVVKKKLGYVPNTFVPNRTLKLRQSGSLTRLASNDTLKLANQSTSQPAPDETETSGGSKSAQIPLTHTRGRSGSRERSGSKLPLKTKPAFR